MKKRLIPLHCLALTAVLLTAAPTFAALLDELRPDTCQALDAQTARDSEAIKQFNTTSEASIGAFKVGKHDEGCRLFKSVWNWVDRVMVRLDTCAAASLLKGDQARARDYQTLRAGFADLRLQFLRIDRREVCQAGF